MITIKLTDSMSTIQKKLNKGGDIIWQNGVYDITKQLIIKSNSVINLNGARLRRCANIQSIFLNKCKTSTTKYSGDGNIRIATGTFEGMGKYSPDNLVTFFHSHDVIINNCTFLDTRCHAVEVNSSKNVTIENCNFLGCNTEEAFREIIQIDTAYAGGFWKDGSSKKSKCYDGTMCENVAIIHCIFNKSNNRDCPKACIGTHTQMLGGTTHKNIKILQNYFICGNEQACLSLIGMDDVQVLSNYFEQYGRVARIYNKDFSYNLVGEKVIPKSGDGKCSNIRFINNTCNGTLGDNKCSGIYIDNDGTSNIHIVDNKFNKKGDTEKYYLYVTDKGCKDLIVNGNTTDLKARIK